MSPRHPPTRPLTGLVVAAVVAAGAAPGAAAVPPPHIDPGRVPVDGPPGPDQPMRQANLCARTITVADPDVTLTAPGFAMLDLARAWTYSTGTGVPVAVIDTGVTPTARLPVVPGGDYIMGGDGLTDCDAHGTVVAAVIAAAPRPGPGPRPRPPVAAFPAPPAAPVVTGAPPPLGPPAPPPPPPTVTVTEAPPAPPADRPAAGPGALGADTPDDPEVPAPPPESPDGVAGVAPHAVIIAIRQSSRAYEPDHPLPGDDAARRKAGTVATLARAIVHAADLGAKVINISVTSCTPAVDPLDQGALGAAAWYAATVKDAVIVAAAGNDGDDDCAQNPLFDPLSPDDPRDWREVKTVSSPSWFTDYVLSVAAVDTTGAPLTRSLAGPWVGVAAPGVAVMGLSPQTGGPVNAYPPVRPGEATQPFWGSSFSAAYVSGVAALVRARFPALTAHQVITRIVATAHHPARGVDNRVGSGVVDPVAALTFDVPAGPAQAPAAHTRLVSPRPSPAPADHRARAAAVGLAAAVLATGWLLALLSHTRAARRRRGRRR
ncbi:S8 family serine peptidase [Mycolicibacillus parakoreensis]|uniref:S8 family serine peptidase n=1 Tax=Mycolicibacillus parakoreensis TaxID=1069221 RepID=A0ABY3U5J1_9MYCO|nr:S8 family serine peptidase [Mycolicibacillus parakoreensis]MCV7316543.1 S8 family serine peptidase [Mycolicibacillus parakoreensis]ULN52767.1 S8 family serine peptidase [Mycolicibacillus parakoreensis]